MKTRTSENSPIQIAELPVGGGRLGLTLCPGKRGDSLFGAPWARDLAMDVAAIRHWGATAVVTLIEPREFALLDVEALPEAIQQQGMEWHHLPITDVSTPDEPFRRRWRLAWPRLRTRLARGESVLVHCRGGLGRAGTVAALALVECGVEPPEAIARVRSVRPGAIETETQERWVLQSRPTPSGARTAEAQLACLLGGALGDALGYRVEFDRLAEIERRYGRGGITLAAATGALVASDDTQMTLFTLEGMARATHAEQITPQIRQAYLAWFATQGRARRLSPDDRGGEGLAQREVMQHARAPGNTCLAALSEGGMGTVAQPINDSKGCGGVMRAAPLGFLPSVYSDADVFRLGVEAAALTHGHVDGYLPAGALALLTRDALHSVPWEASVAKVLALLERWPGHGGTARALQVVISAATPGAPSRAQVATLGAGWVGEEALAVGLYCAMSASSFEQCIEAAANHDGDSDSTASIAGQLYGARHGLAVLPFEAAYRIDVLEPLLAVIDAWECAGRGMGH